MMTRLLSFFHRKAAAKSATASPTSLELGSALACMWPRCRQNLQGHRFQQFAMTVAKEEPTAELLAFIQAARRFDWEELSKHQFDPRENALAAYALSCPNGDLSMLLVKDPFELYDSKSLEIWEPLPQEAAERWKPLLVNANWEVF